MENQFYDNEFEKFLQQQTRMHRMYPTDAVWKGIYKQLHGHRTWPGLNFFAILTIAALTICTVLTTDNSHPLQIKKQSQPNLIAETSFTDHLDPVKTTQLTFELVKSRESASGAAVPMAVIPTIQADNNQPKQEDKVLNDVSLSEIQMTVSLKPSLTVVESDAALNTTSTNREENTDNIIAVDKTAEAIDVLEKGITQIEKENDHPVAKEYTVDDYLLEQAQNIVQLNQKAKTSKWSLQFYITPSASFRKLANNSFPSTVAGPVALNASHLDVNKVVNHKPGLGTEIGLAAAYQIGEKLSVKAGAQLNIRQYNIDAYYSNLEVTSIALVRGNSVDTFNTYAMYNTKEGYRPTELENKYYQVSAPIGLEYNFIQNKRLGLALGATLQPTYTFTPKSSYFISTDLKNYANGTSLLRNWNVNSTLEAIIKYKIGTIEWRLAPQVRYQHLPTYSKPYPIREYLFDYGVKIGFATSL